MQQLDYQVSPYRWHKKENKLRKLIMLDSPCVPDFVDDETSLVALEGDSFLIRFLSGEASSVSNKANDNKLDFWLP